MDILAHTLWTNAIARGVNAVADKKENKKFHISPGWTAFFGVFPDLFAFMIPFVLRFYSVIFGQSSAVSLFLRTRGGIGGAEDGLGSLYLYQYSHSLVIWAVVFLAVWIFFKRPRYELFGWMLHILIDIPSHVLAFYPTPFLFPISDYKFPYGIQWSNQWFMVINYGALLAVWGSISVKGFFAKKAHKD